MRGNRISRTPWVITFIAGAAMVSLGSIASADGFKRGKWQASDAPAAIKQFLSLGEMPSGYGTGVSGAVGENKSKKKLKSKGPKKSKKFNELVKDGTNPPKLRKAFKAKFNKKNEGAKVKPIKPKVKLRPGKDGKAGTLAKPFKSKRDDKNLVKPSRASKTVLKNADGKPIADFKTLNPLVSKPAKAKPAKTKAKIKNTKVDQKWQLQWPQTDFKALKKETKEAKARSDRKPRRRVKLWAKVDGKVANKKDGPKNQANEDKAPKPATFVLKKQFRNGEAVSFNIREFRRRPRIQIFSVPQRRRR